MIKLGEVKNLILEKLEKTIKENSQIIEQLLKIDNKYSKAKINVNMLIEVIQQ